METREQEAKELSEKLVELMQLQELEGLVQNNIFEFQDEGKTYRVRKPNVQEKDEINKIRMTKYLEMLKDPIYIFEKQLREIYKTKNIDLDKIDKDLLTYQKTQDNLLDRLAETTIPKDVDTLKDQIIEIRNDQQLLMKEKNELLQYCIEKQLEDYTNQYMTYLLLEVKVEETWKKAYNNFEEFLKTDNHKLIMRSAYYLAGILVQNVL